MLGTSKKTPSTINRTSSRNGSTPYFVTNNSMTPSLHEIGTVISNITTVPDAIIAGCFLIAVAIVIHSLLS